MDALQYINKIKVYFNFKKSLRKRKTTRPKQNIFAYTWQLKKCTHNHLNIYLMKIKKIIYFIFLCAYI